MKSLIDICEPLFLYLCLINSEARSNNIQELTCEKVKEDIYLILEQICNTSKDDSNLSRQFLQIELILLFFADSIIYNSKLPFTDQWALNRIAYDKKEMAGDKKFFDIAEKYLKEPTLDSYEWLKIIYRCLSLGFTGIYRGKPDKIKYLMERIHIRVPSIHKSEFNDKLFSDAYENVDMRNLRARKWLSPKRIAAIFTGLILIYLILSYFIYSSVSGKFLNLIKEVILYTS
jgi:type IV/VI secretion system ImpK/VasF family protein